MNWPKANKTSVDAKKKKKTDMIAFKSKTKNNFSWKIRLNGKGICPTTSVNYLGIKFDENFACQLVKTIC